MNNYNKIVQNIVQNVLSNPSDKFANKTYDIGTNKINKDLYPMEVKIWRNLSPVRSAIMNKSLYK